MAGRPARTYIQQLCSNTGCIPEDLREAMDDKERWREGVRDIMMMMIMKKPRFRMQIFKPDGSYCRLILALVFLFGFVLCSDYLSKDCTFGKNG